MSDNPDALQRLTAQVRQHLGVLYPALDSAPLCAELFQIMGLPGEGPEPRPFANHWSESDVLMISYADSIRADDEKPLRTLAQFIDERLADRISWLHILPFYPFSSDDGFAVMDYDAVRPELGSWDDVSALAGRVRLMADLVINHCSSAHPWFINFQQGTAPGRDYFVTAPAGADLREVVRPRTSSLLRPTPTPAGEALVWCTFSHDQVDLNFTNPRVLVEFVRIIRHYMDRGVRIFRLDAVAFLWKQPGTNCLNLDQTHEIVRLLRTLTEHRDPGSVLITETNIPNRENLSYFGNANEAHIIYNFSLPPLLVNALVTGSSRHLKTWMMGMPPAQHGTTFLNFLASHDGIGLRPAEGLLEDAELDQLIATMESFGGHVSWRALDGDERKPYEINIALVDALQGTVDGPDEWQLERFCCAHAIMLALEGVPAFYIHSLLATHNDHPAVALSGHPRSINRHQWDADELRQRLDDPASIHSRAFTRLTALIAIRRRQPAFHPNATQFTMHLGDAIFAFWRLSLDKRQSIFALNNLSAETQTIALADINLIGTDDWQDLISGRPLPSLTGTLELSPYQTVWLGNTPARTAAA